jgi:hypothetical protein
VPSRDPQATVLRGLELEGWDTSLGVQLACLLEQVESATNQAKRLMLDRSEMELTARVRPDSWSAAECLDHLAMTTRACMPAIAGKIASTPRLTTSRPLRCDALAKLLIRMLEPPYWMRHRAHRHLSPRRNDFPSAWRDFGDSQRELAEVIRSGVGLALDTVKVQSPVCSRMSYTVYGALGILSAHQRRHLWQAQQILRALDRCAA